MKETRFYNVLFPIWMLFIFPVTWLYILPGNFIIDSAVMLITLYVLKQRENIWSNWIKNIWLVWIFGFISDAVGGALLFGIVLFNDSLSLFPSNEDWIYHNIVDPISRNPFATPFGFITVMIAIAIAGLLIYLLNYHISFRKLLPDKTLRRKLALSMAIVTAPWTYLLPSQWFWSNY